MKLSTIVFGAAMAAEPIDYLNTIKTAAHEILSHEDVTPRSNKWISVWEGKFDRTIDRMERNFQRRCGSYDANTAPVSADFDYDTSNPCAGMKKVLNEFSNWSNRHLSGCNGQINHNHHGKRMTRWAEHFESVLNCSQAAEPIIAAVAKLDGQVSYKNGEIHINEFLLHILSAFSNVVAIMTSKYAPLIQSRNIICTAQVRTISEIGMASTQSLKKETI